MRRLSNRTLVCVLASVLLISSCASLSEPSRPLTPAEQRMRDQANDFNRTILEGAGIGALAGAGIGAAACRGDLSCILIGAAAGAAAGSAGGYYYAQKKEGYVNEEQRLDAIIADIRKDNKNLEGLVKDARTVAAADKQKMDQIDKALAANTISQEQAKRELDAVDDNREVLQDTIANLKDRRDEWKEVASKARADTDTAKMARLDREIKTLENQIASLENELDTLTTRRRASLVG